MLFVERKQGDLFGIRDTDDNTLEYLSVSDIKKALKLGLKIYGVSNKGIRVVSFKEIVESVKSKYMLLGDERGFREWHNSFSMNYKNYKSGRYFYRVDDYGFSGSKLDKLELVTTSDMTEGLDYTCDCCVVVLPDTIIEIGEGAFSNCSSLTEVVLPNSLVRIGESAFSGCKELETVEAVDNKETVEAPTNLDKKVESGGVAALLEAAVFMPVASVKKPKVTFPNSVVEIGDSAFEGCESIFSVALPDSITRVGRRAFMDCGWLNRVKISNSVTKIEYGTFWGCKCLEEVIIPESVTEIEESAFQGCCDLEVVKIPDSVTRIGADAFSECYKIECFEIPKRILKHRFEELYWDMDFEEVLRDMESEDDDFLPKQINVDASDLIWESLSDIVHLDDIKYTLVVRD